MFVEKWSYTEWISFRTLTDHNAGYRAEIAETVYFQSCNLSIVSDWNFFFLAGKTAFPAELKAGIHLKAVFTPPKIGLTEISRSRFKQYKNPTLITQINVLGCFVNFFVIFRYIWEEIVFLKRVVKFGEIRNS